VVGTAVVAAVVSVDGTTGICSIGEDPAELKVKLIGT
jgi:hypothetical protein